MKFFKVYDASKDEKILKLQKKLEIDKKLNNKVKSTRATDISEKSEIQNLFLDCIDESKKEIIRKRNLSYYGASSQNNSQCNISQRAIQEDLVMNRETLISVFEDMFGNNATLPAND